MFSSRGQLSSRDCTGWDEKLGLGSSEGCGEVKNWGPAYFSLCQIFGFDFI